jgi:hypothetical protein
MLPMTAQTIRPVRKGQHTLMLSGRRVGLWIGLSVAVLCLGIVLAAATSSASTRRMLPSGSREICGEISTGGPWTVSQSPYSVTCDTSLPPGVTLEIEPGVEIRFSPGVSLTISGTLHASGTPDQPITFTSGLESPTPGDWGGLHFVSGSSESRLASCVVEYATNGIFIYAGPGETVSPTFTDCIVHHNSQHGFHIEGLARACDAGLALPTIAGCSVEQNDGCGIFGYGHGDPGNGCSEFTGGGVGGSVSGSTIWHNQGPGICLWSELDGLGRGDVWIAMGANVISGNAGHGIHLDGSAPIHSRVENNLIYENAGAGVQSEAKHEETDLYVANNTIVGNDGGGVIFNRSALQVHFINNIVIENAGYGLVANATDDPQASNNDLWNNASGDYLGCETGAADISADPLFRDRTAGDFHLSSRSPCIEAGTSDGAPATDFDGVSRPQGGEIDIGAYEQGQPSLWLPLVLCE